MATCKECIHEKLCVIKAFPDAFENTQWDKEPCDHFLSTADVAPKSEVAKSALFELKKLIHNKAVYTNSQDIPNYIQLKVFDAILQNYINNLK